MDYFRKQFANIFELPEEIMLDLPLVMMVGQEKLYIENHKGIIQYNEEKIKIRVKAGFIIMSGQELIIEDIDPEKVFISGRIEGISYERN